MHASKAASKSSKERESLISKEIGKRRKSIFRDRIGSILSELARI